MPDRKEIRKVDEIKDAGVVAEDGRYRLTLKTDNGVNADILMISKQLVLEKARVKVAIELPEGIRVAHEKAVVSCLVRFTDRVLHFSGPRHGASSTNIPAAAWGSPPAAPPGAVALL